MYLIKKGLLYVAKEGRKYSYTNQLKYARRYKTREKAQQDKCGNETIVSLCNEIGE